MSFLEERVRFLSLLKNKNPTFLIEEIQDINFKRIDGLLFLENVHIYCRWVSGGSLIHDENRFSLYLNSKNSLGLIHYISISRASGFPSEVVYPSVVCSDFKDSMVDPEDDSLLRQFLVDPVKTGIGNICLQGMVGSIIRQIAGGQEQGQSLETDGPLMFFGIPEIHYPFDRFDSNSIIFGDGEAQHPADIFVDQKMIGNEELEEIIAEDSFITIPYREWKKLNPKSEPVN